VECEVARLGTLRDSSLPRLLHTPGGAWPRSRNLGAGAKLPRAALNFDVVGHMAAESVRMAHSQKLSLARVQSVGQQGVDGGCVWEDLNNLESCRACMGEPT